MIRIKMHRVVIAWCLLLLPIYSMANIDDYKPLSVEKLHKVDITVNKDFSSTEITEIQRKLIHRDAVLYLSNMRLKFAPSIGEQLEVLEAYTILPNGEKIPVPLENIKEHQQEIDSNSLEFDDRRTKLIIFPRVELNSEIYIRYKTEKKPYYPEQFFHRYKFDNKFVWEKTEIIFSHPANQQIQVKVDGITGGEVEAEQGLKRYQFKYQNLNAIEEEPGAVNSFDYAPYFSASTLSKHEDVGSLYWLHAKPRTENSAAIKELALSLTKDAQDKKKKAEILYYWVQKNIRYVSDIIERGGLIPNPVDSILEKRVGDCKDHASILSALLTAVGIDASPALINLGNAYTISGAPTSSPFNHAITYVAELDLYLDSTSQYSRFGQLYEEIADKPTVITKTGKIDRTPSLKSSDNKSYSEIELTVKEDGKIEGKTTYKPSGATEINSRNNGIYTKNATIEKIIKDYLNSHNESGIGTFQITSIENLKENFVATSSYTLEEQSNFPGVGAMRLPIGFSPAHIKHQTNQSVSEKRRYSWVCHSEDIEERYRITLPKTVQITRIPQSVNFENKTIKFQSSYKLDGNTLNATRKLVKTYASHVCGGRENQEWMDALKSIKRDQRSFIFYH